MQSFVLYFLQNPWTISEITQRTRTCRFQCPKVVHLVATFYYIRADIHTANNGQISLKHPYLSCYLKDVVKKLWIAGKMARLKIRD